MKDKERKEGALGDKFASFSNHSSEGKLTQFDLALANATDKRTDVWSRDFMIWKINFGLWAMAWAGLWEKRVWADFEQLLRPVFSLFRGQKKN